MVTTSAPTSPEQRSVLARNIPGGIAFNMPCVLDLPTPVDLEALVYAITYVVNRHGSLRTRFGVDGEQLIEPEGHPVDLLVVYNPAKGVDAFVTGVVQQAFDLHSRPPVRIRLVVASDDKIVLVMVIHHAIFDGMSYAQVLNEVDRVYSMVANDMEIDLGEMPPSYVEYALARNTELGSPADPTSLESCQVRYWRSALDGARFDFPMPFVRNEIRPPKGPSGQISTVIGTDLMEAVLFAAAAAGVSIFVVVHTATALALRSLGCGDEIIIFTTFSDPRIDFSQTVGCRINSLPVRLQIAEHDIVSEILDRDADAVYGAMEHLAVPGPMLLKRLYGEAARDCFSRVFVSYLGWSAESVMPTLGARQLTAELGVNRATLATYFHEHRAANGDLSLLLTTVYDSDIVSRKEAEVFINAISSALALVSTRLREPGGLRDVTGAAHE